MIDDFARTQTLDEYQANQYFTQRGTRYILEHPGDVALTAGLKVFVSLTGYAFHFRLLSIRNLVALSYNPPFIVVGIIGLAILWRRCRGSDVQLLFTVTMAAALAVTTLLLVTGSCGYRYRLGIDDFLLIGAAVVVDRLLGRRRTGGEDSQRQSEKEYVHSGIA